MAREDPQMKIRLPVELKNSIEEAARRAERTLNSEIVHRLQQSFISYLPPTTLSMAVDATANLAGGEDAASPRRLLDRMAQLEQAVEMLQDEKLRALEELHGQLQRQELVFSGEGELIHGAESAASPPAAVPRLRQRVTLKKKPDEPVPYLHETQVEYGHKPRVTIRKRLD